MKDPVYRMCVQSRIVLPKEEMLRIAIVSDNVKIDTDAKLQGRGIYIQNDLDVINCFLKKKKLPLKLDVTKQQEVRNILTDYINEQI